EDARPGGREQVGVRVGRRYRRSDPARRRTRRVRIKESMAMKSLRTAAEQMVGPELARAFETSSDATEAKLETFPRYARRKTITRFITLYELFKLALPVKGSIVECGVFRGFGLMTWAHLSAVLEPAD